MSLLEQVQRDQAEQQALVDWRQDRVARTLLAAAREANRRAERYVH